MNRQELLELGSDIDKMIYKYHEAGQRHATKNAEAWFKEQSMKIIFNEKKKDLIGGGHNVSQSEIQALASEEYKVATEQTKKAKEEANSLSIDMKTLEYKLMAQFSLNKLAVSGGKLY